MYRVFCLGDEEGDGGVWILNQRRRRRRRYLFDCFIPKTERERERSIEN